MPGQESVHCTHDLRRVENGPMAQSFERRQLDARDGRLNTPRLGERDLGIVARMQDDGRTAGLRKQATAREVRHSPVREPFETALEYALSPA